MFSRSVSDYTPRSFYEGDVQLHNQSTKLGWHPALFRLPRTPIIFSYLDPLPLNPTRVHSDSISAFQSSFGIHLIHDMAGQKGFVFEDFLPIMADKLGGEGLIGELCNGFQLLMDGNKGVITFESLKRNAGLLGLQGLRDEELLSMLREGDMDGDGALNQMEFCVLMFRLSPDLMEESEEWLQDVLQQELEGL